MLDLYIGIFKAIIKAALSVKFTCYLGQKGT